MLGKSYSCTQAPFEAPKKNPLTKSSYLIGRRKYLDRKPTIEEIHEDSVDRYDESRETDGVLSMFDEEDGYNMEYNYGSGDDKDSDMWGTEVRPKCDIKWRRKHNLMSKNCNVPIFPGPAGSMPYQSCTSNQHFQMFHMKHREKDRMPVSSWTTNVHTQTVQCTSMIVEKIFKNHMFFSFILFAVILILTVVYYYCIPRTSISKDTHQYSLLSRLLFILKKSIQEISLVANNVEFL